MGKPSLSTACCWVKWLSKSLYPPFTHITYAEGAFA